MQQCSFLLKSTSLHFITEYFYYPENPTLIMNLRPLLTILLGMCCSFPSSIYCITGFSNGMCLYDSDSERYEPNMELHFATDDVTRFDNIQHIEDFLFN